MVMTAALRIGQTQDLVQNGPKMKEIETLEYELGQGFH